MTTKAQLRLVLATGAIAALMISAGCKHKVAPPPPPPPAPAPLATVTVSANPTAIERGQSSTLTWATTHAVKVTLNGTAVDINGSQPVSPTESTDYEVVATNADGKTASASARVTVTAPPPPPAPTPSAPAPTVSELFAENIHDAFFDFDKATLRADAQQALTQDAAFLKAHPDLHITVEGHCDDRGSAEYNLALGQRRATAAKDFLVSQGVAAANISTISYGKEKPFCTDDNENCWQQNRRAHIVMAQ